MRPDLDEMFSQLSDRFFEGLLPLPELLWNPRLRVCAGRFHPGTRMLQTWHVKPKMPRIEIAVYLLEHPESSKLIRDTLGHEMIHYWLWLRGLPCGHTPVFVRKMKEMGVPRFNPVPIRRPYKYLYLCPGCHEQIRTRRKLNSSALACAACCKKHSRGKYDERFKLRFLSEL